MKLKVDVKIDRKKIESAVRRETGNAVLRQGIEITCKKCGAKCHLPVGASICPFCHQPYRLTIDM